MPDIMADIEHGLMKDNKYDYQVGDTVKVHVLVKEGEKERIQIFQGIVIAEHNGRNRSTFTVRKISGGVGVERVFPCHSPYVKNVETVRRGKVRRAKLYFLRERSGKAARVKERRVTT
jgi:large subunit ribosomal protein L19